MSTNPGASISLDDFRDVVLVIPVENIVDGRGSECSGSNDGSEERSATEEGRSSRRSGRGIIFLCGEEGGSGVLRCWSWLGDLVVW